MRPCSFLTVTLIVLAIHAIELAAFLITRYFQESRNSANTIRRIINRYREDIQ